MSETIQTISQTCCCAPSNVFSKYGQRTNVLMAKVLDEMYKGFQSSKAWQKLSFDDKVDLATDYLLLRELILNLKR